MPTLWIEEYQGVPSGTGGTIPAHDAKRKIAEQKLTPGGGAVQSSAFNAKTSFICIHTDTACNIEISADPTASTSTTHLAAGVYRDFAVPQGASWKIGTV
jgi:hypothetical protein